MFHKISPCPSLPKRGIFPPFGMFSLPRAGKGEGRRDFIKQYRYYYETVNKFIFSKMLQYLQYGIASTESFSFLNFVSVFIGNPCKIISFL